jgi:hypothetical protein
MTHFHQFLSASREIGPFSFRRTLLLASLVTASFSAGCSSDSNNNDATGGSGQGGAGNNAGASNTAGATNNGGGNNQAAEYAPCDDAERIGRIALKVVPQSSMGGGYTELNGAVYDKVDPANVWVEKKTEGDCRLVTGPKLSCAPSCESGQVCAGNNVCTSAPVGQNAGTISVAGLGSALSSEFKANVYYKPFTGSFPPAPAGTALTLSASGGMVPAFSIAANGIDPLVVAEEDISLDTTKPLTITWGAPSKPSVSRVVISLDLAHHGNVAAKLICDVEDTGSATIPVSMLTALAAEGVAGFPSVAITRQSANSTNVANGCVEFDVSSSVDRQLLLPGVVSCMCPNSTCEPCTASQICKANYTCG